MNFYDNCFLCILFQVKYYLVTESKGVGSRQDPLKGEICQAAGSSKSLGPRCFELCLV